MVMDFQPVLVIVMISMRYWTSETMIMMDIHLVMEIVMTMIHL